MRTDEAEAKFQTADEFYRAGRFKAALAALDELDRAYPNERHILLPRARCLYKLDRKDEAVTLCDVMIAEHRYDKAEQLKRRITQEQAPESEPTAVGESPETGLGEFSLSSLNIDLDETPIESAFNKRKVSADTGGSGAGRWVAAVLLLAGLGGGWFYFQSDGAGDVPPAGDTADAVDALLSTPGEINLNLPPELITFERFSVRPGQPQPVPVEYSVWTDCGGYGNFQAKYSGCEPAMMRMSAPRSVIEYRVLGVRAERCMLEVRYVESAALPNLAGKTMTCPCDTSLEFTAVMARHYPASIANGAVACTGALADALREAAKRF